MSHISVATFGGKYMSIDFSKYETNNDEQVMLRDMDLDVAAQVTFDEVLEINGSLLAKVTTDLVGTALWLWSSEYGAQNGFNSLKKAAGGPENIEGNTYTITRIPSEKSPAGWAYRWTV